MSSLHESTDPAVRYLWERAEERDENGEPEIAQALLEAARHVESLVRTSTPSMHIEAHPAPIPPRVGEVSLAETLRGATRGTKPSPADMAKLAREFYAIAVAHTRSQDEADEAVDRIIQRLDDVLLGIGLGRRNR